jgi:outer membrane lipoprotein SlyB
MSTRRLDLTLARGSIADVNSRAVVVGLFRNVDPDGAAGAVDRRVEGRLTEIVRSRMFRADAGAIFVLPTSRTPLLADHLVLAGLGTIDRFDPQVVEVVARNVAKTLARANVDEFATVALGAGSGQDAASCLTHLVAGVLAGAREAGRRQLRAMTVVESRADRLRQLRVALADARRLPFAGDFEMVVDEAVIAPRLPPAAEPPRRRVARRSPVYLHVRTTRSTASELVLRLAALTAGSRAALVDAESVLDRGQLDRQLAVITSSRFDASRLEQLGRRLGAMAIPKAVARELAAAQAHHVNVIHDRDAAVIPWEAIRLGDWVPALGAGLSRRYLADDVAVARWAERQSHDRQLRILVVVDPTRDLPAARAEGRRLDGLASRVEGLAVEALVGAAATRHAVLEAMASERFDVLHYAGHAFFSEAAPGESGLECADGALRAHELLRLRSLPALMFFNACEAARVRQRGLVAGTERVGTRKDLGTAPGFAETLMRAGVANYVGTHWPVGDQAAGVFADRFYRRLLRGQSIGQSLVAGRKAVESLGSVDWADYIHFGDPEFSLKIAR